MSHLLLTKINHLWVLHVILYFQYYLLRSNLQLSNHKITFLKNLSKNERLAEQQQLTTEFNPYLKVCRNGLHGLLLDVIDTMYDAMCDVT